MIYCLYTAPTVPHNTPNHNTAGYGKRREKRYFDKDNEGNSDLEIQETEYVESLYQSLIKDAKVIKIVTQ